METIAIRDAYENNLKHLDLDICLNSFTCVTGCSGCGKSSLVYDTIYAESQREFLEGINGNIYGQKLMDRPKVGSIRNLRPALNVSQNYYNVNPRSTVGTTTEISYYLRSLFALANSQNGRTVSENTFSPNNPKACCPNCSGLGVETAVSEDLLVPDRSKTLREGAILLFKGSPESKEQKYLEAFCEHYGINPDEKVSDLDSKQLDLLLHANEHIRYMLSYREGKRRKKHYVSLQGAVTLIQERQASNDSSEISGAFSRYLEQVPCHVCNGARLRPEILKYHVRGLNYSTVEHMELTSLHSWLKGLLSCPSGDGKDELASELIKEMLVKLEALLQLHVGYLSLDRSIPTLSGGERQRVRIASQLTCSLNGLIYILDEPCRGLHHRDIDSIIGACKNMIARNNTVIAIEHNKKFIAAADHLIELGPVGGPDGGHLLQEQAGPSNYHLAPVFKPRRSLDSFIDIHGISFRNIKNQDIKFPIGGITCITGVSGSGKSTLATAIMKCFTGRAESWCRSFKNADTITHTVQVDQAPIGKTPRSTVVSYLDIYDEIRTLFSKTEAAHDLKLNKSMFSMNVKGGRCECCQGTGLQKIDLNYLPSTYITCPECRGRRFNDKVLSVTYEGKTIYDVLETPIEDIIETFRGNKKISGVLESAISLGLGYLKLGQMSMNLSGGEAQRVRLAKALGAPSRGRTLYILDEPTSGLSDSDIDKLLHVLFELEQRQDTIIAIEHNIEFIAKSADYIIDLGLSGGEEGGKVAAQGVPQEVFSQEGSSLYGLA